MNQWHQAFLIARIIPKNETEARYLGVAAVHDDRFGGTRPLEATIRMIKLLRQPQNAMIVREELQALHGKHGRSGTRHVSPKILAPYATFLFQCAFYTDTSDDRNVFWPLKHIMIEDANMEKTDNKRTTVIDVTDPENPRYCFNPLNGYETLSAQDYVQSYLLPLSLSKFHVRSAGRFMTPKESIGFEISIPLVSKAIEELLNQFSGVKLVEPYMLAEVWANRPGASKMVFASNNLKDTKQSFATISPLAQISLKPALANAVTNDQLNALDHLLTDPEIRRLAKQIIVEDSSLRSKSVALISQIVALELEYNSEAIIDLSKLALTSEQIIDIITPHRLISLNLSHNPNVTSETLEIVLTKFENIRRLILFDTSTTSDDLIALLKRRPSLFYKLSALIHPVFLDQMDEELAWASDYGHYLSSDLHSSVGITLPMFSPAQVVQTIIPLLTRVYDPDLPQSRVTTIIQSEYALEYREEMDPWSERLAVSMCPQIYSKMALLRLRGWLFLCDRSYHLHICKYAWIRFNSKAVEECETIRGIKNPEERGIAAVRALREKLFEVYDFQGFVDACVAEGRPVIPEGLRRTTLEGLKKLNSGDFGQIHERKNEYVEPNKDAKLKFLPITSASEVFHIYQRLLT